jgi:hypothetical protein
VASKGCAILRAEVDVRGTEALAMGMVCLPGCWKTDLPPLPVGTIPFEPTANPTLAGWVVEEFETTMECPDSSLASIYAVYPTAATGSVPVAVVLHSGSFDYIIDPPASDPIGGPSYQSTTRLTHSWAVRKAYATLGMYDDDDPNEQSVGALAATLATNNVAMILPANCWGDWWHNQQSVAENNYATEHFYRNGRTLSSFAYQLASEPGFAAAQGITIPVTLDTSRVYLVGLGEGGRGVGELLVNGASPDAIVIDSSVDDLNAYYNDPVLYEATITGLNRIFPTGASSTGAASLGNPSLDLPPTVFIYSSLDSQMPSGSTNAARARLGADDLVIDGAVQRHVLTGSDSTLSAQAVAYLLAH